MIKKTVQFLFILIITLQSCNNEENSNETSTLDKNNIDPNSILNYSVLSVYSHDPTYYTQGLVYYQDFLYEGTGLYGQSQLVKYKIEDGKPLQGLLLDKQYFGEGITIFNHKIYQLTWKEHKIFVYDVKTLQKVQTLNWIYDGWGITHNDTNLIISTGTSNLYFVDPNNLNIIKTIGVTNNYGSVDKLNELEYVQGKIYANVYMTDDIVMINPNSGQVEKKADLSKIFTQINKTNNPKSIDPGYVLNGIAYNQKNNSFFITGKCWDVMIEVKFQ